MGLEDDVAVWGGAEVCEVGVGGSGAAWVGAGGFFETHGWTVGRGFGEGWVEEGSVRGGNG